MHQRNDCYEETDCLAHKLYNPTNKNITSSTFSSQTPVLPVDISDPYPLQAKTLINFNHSGYNNTAKLFMDCKG